MTNWIEKNIEKESKIMDLGCGNGHFLRELCQMGYKNLMGIDYSANAVYLARKLTNSPLNISYETIDILKNKNQIMENEQEEDLKNEQEMKRENKFSFFDLFCDKGTFDALTLKPELPKNEIIKGYKKFICNNSISKTSILFITSCNWTLDELKVELNPEFELIESLPCPNVFKYGNSQGTTVTTALFKIKI